jgi:hypothetical protein
MSHYKNINDIMKDNLWLSEDRLQIIIENTDSSLDGPFVVRRDSACIEAKKRIEPEMKKRYPSIEGISYSKKIIKTLYTGKGECTLVVHVVGSQLKKKLTQ